tara:strand:+ start:218 stop:619 length:402 start_codon:yes stop_codon:yes gene_type:complete
MSSLEDYEKLKSKLRPRYKKTDKQKNDRDKIINNESKLLESKKMKEENDEKEIEETEEQKELREKEEKNITKILEKYILEENKEAEEIRRILNKKPELFQNLKMTFIFDKMTELYAKKSNIQYKVEPQMNFLI